MKTEISNQDDVIDSRDVVARIEELAGERQDLADAVEEAFDLLAGADAEEESDDKAAHCAEAAESLKDAQDALAEWDSDYQDELKALESLAEEAAGYASDWRHGATLIRDSYFVEYCEELVKDIGDLPQSIPEYLVIDWEATADNLRADYTSVEFDGVTYWIR